MNVWLYLRSLERLFLTQKLLKSFTFGLILVSYFFCLATPQTLTTTNAFRYHVDIKIDLTNFCRSIVNELPSVSRTRTVVSSCTSVLEQQESVHFVSSSASN